MTNENPFARLRRQQLAEQQQQQTASANSVKQENINNASNSTVKNQNVTSLITIGDSAVQNLLVEQDNPLELQEKLKALFSYENKTDDPFPINGRELHEFLNTATAYKDWFPRNIGRAGLTEGTDFCSKMSESTGGRPATYHMLTVEAAKEITVVQNSALGKLVRKYLFWAEKKLREITGVISQQQQVQVPTTPGEMLIAMDNALVETEQRIDKKISGLQQNFDVMKDIQTMSQDRIERMDQDLTALRQRIEKNNSVFSILTEERNYDPIAANGNVTVAEMADILHDRFGYDTGRDRLYNWLADNRMIIRYKKKGFKATKRYEDLGWFETEVKSVNTPFSPSPITQYKVWITQKGRQGIAACFGLENR